MHRPSIHDIVVGDDPRIVQEHTSVPARHEYRIPVFALDHSSVGEVGGVE